jgi:LAS superfamily LD-carboxypeptidase LdcB
LNALELTGRARTHLVELPGLDCSVHQHAAAPFLAMRRAAASAGLDLWPASGFRDFERQLAIWNAKYSGTVPVRDAQGFAVDVAALAPAARIAAILHWSALPGASRHHWGTDLDLIDRAALPPGYRVRLAPDEYAPGGPFAAASAWLDANASRFGFFRPYRGVSSGVQPEPWHFSFAPTAEAARRRLSAALLGEALADAPLLGKEHVLERLDELHARYVATVDFP